ncbi:hypothetical protein GCM10009611_22890 [Arthrobacter roseus]
MTVGPDQMSTIVENFFNVLLGNHCLLLTQCDGVADGGTSIDTINQQITAYLANYVDGVLLLLTTFIHN